MKKRVCAVCIMCCTNLFATLKVVESTISIDSTLRQSWPFYLIPSWAAFLLASAVVRSSVLPALRTFAMYRCSSPRMIWGAVKVQRMLRIHLGILPSLLICKGMRKAEGRESILCDYHRFRT